MGEQGRRGVFFGWWIVLAAFLVLTFTSMTGAYGLSLFYKRLIDYFGWGRTALAGAISLSRLEAGFLGGIEGFLVDRFGPRIMILLGVILTSIGMALLSFIDSLLAFYLIFILLVTVGRSLSSMIAIDTTVANWFIRRRGTAFGLLRSAVAVGAAGVIVVAWFIDQYGWRTAFVASGVGTLLVGIPAALVMRHRPEQYGMLPDGRAPEQPQGRTRPQPGVADAGKGDGDGGVRVGAAVSGDAAASADVVEARPGAEVVAAQQEAVEEEDIGMTVTQALRSRPFWALSFGFAIRLMVTGAATLHAIPLVEDMGHSRATAAAVLGSMGMVSIVGRLGGGFLNDILGTKTVNVASVCTLALSCLIIAYAQELWHVWLFVALYAPSYGCSAATMPAIKGDYFGRRAFGSILGLSGMVQVCGSMLGPVYAAFVFETTGSYRIAFLSFAALLLIAAALFVSLRRPRYR